MRYQGIGKKKKRYQGLNPGLVSHGQGKCPTHSAIALALLKTRFSL